MRFFPAASRYSLPDASGPRGIDHCHDFLEGEKGKLFCKNRVNGDKRIGDWLRNLISGARNIGFVGLRRCAESQVDGAPCAPSRSASCLRVRCRCRPASSGSTRPLTTFSPVLIQRWRPELLQQFRHSFTQLEPMPATTRRSDPARFGTARRTSRLPRFCGQLLRKPAH